MSVITEMSGGLGNNFFHYTLGRIIAEHHGLALVCEDPSCSQTFTFLDYLVDSGPMLMLSGVTEHFPNAPMRIPGRVVDEPIQRFASSGRWSGKLAALQEVLEDPTPRRIRLGGAFPRRYEYLAPYRDRVREWLRPKPIDLPFAIGPNDVVVNIRRGFDFGILGWTLSLSYYHRILERMHDVARIYVCGTCIDAQVRKGLERYDPIYYDGTAMEQFVFMTRFNRMALSNSTFAWWAAFVSDAVEIYAPPMGGTDLNIREPRYIPIRDVEFARFAPFTVTARGRANGGRNLDPESAELLQWMVDEDRPISLGDVTARFTSSGLPHWMANQGRAAVPTEGAPTPKEVRLFEVYRNLIDQGLVSQDVRYLDTV